MLTSQFRNVYITYNGSIFNEHSTKKKYCRAKLWKRIATINDIVSILSSWEKMNYLNLVKHNRIQIIQAWLTAQWSKELSYEEKCSQFFNDSSLFKILNIWKSCKTFLPMNYPIHIDLSMSQQCWQFHTLKYTVIAPHSVFQITPPWDQEI